MLYLASTVLIIASLLVISHLVYSTVKVLGVRLSRTYPHKTIEDILHEQVNIELSETTDKHLDNTSLETSHQQTLRLDPQRGEMYNPAEDALNLSFSSDSNSKQKIVIPATSEFSFSKIRLENIIPWLPQDFKVHKDTGFTLKVSFGPEELPFIRDLDINFKTCVTFVNGFFIGEQSSYYVTGNTTLKVAYLNPCTDKLELNMLAPEPILEHYLQTLKALQAVAVREIYTHTENSSRSRLSSSEEKFRSKDQQSVVTVTKQRIKHLSHQPLDARPK